MTFVKLPKTNLKFLLAHTFHTFQFDQTWRKLRTRHTEQHKHLFLGWPLCDPWDPRDFRQTTHDHLPFPVCILHAGKSVPNVRVLVLLVHQMLPNIPTRVKFWGQSHWAVSHRISDDPSGLTQLFFFDLANVRNSRIFFRGIFCWGNDHQFLCIALVERRGKSRVSLFGVQSVLVCLISVQVSFEKKKLNCSFRPALSKVSIVVSSWRNCTEVSSGRQKKLTRRADFRRAFTPSRTRCSRQVRDKNGSSPQQPPHSRGTVTCTDLLGLKISFWGELQRMWCKMGSGKLFFIATREKLLLSQNIPISSFKMYVAQIISAEFWRQNGGGLIHFSVEALMKVIFVFLALISVWTFLSQARLSDFRSQLYKNFCSTFKCQRAPKPTSSFLHLETLLCGKDQAKIGEKFWSSAEAISKGTVCRHAVLVQRWCKNQSPLPRNKKWYIQMTEFSCGGPRISGTRLQFILWK